MGSLKLLGEDLVESVELRKAREGLALRLSVNGVLQGV